jgi:hypothetical protein
VKERVKFRYIIWTCLTELTQTPNNASLIFREQNHFRLFPLPQFISLLWRIFLSFIPFFQTFLFVSFPLSFASFLFLPFFTKRHGWVVKAPTSYSGGLEFKSRPGHRLYWLKIFVIFLSPPGKFQGSALNQITRASSHIRSNSSFTHHPFIPRSVYSELLKKRRQINYK